MTCESGHTALSRSGNAVRRTASSFTDARTPEMSRNFQYSLPKRVVVLGGRVVVLGFIFVVMKAVLDSQNVPIISPWTVAIAAICVGFAVAGEVARIVLRRREPVCFTVTGTEVVARWRCRSRWYDLSEISVGPSEQFGGFPTTAVRVTAAGEAFLVFSDLVDFERFMALLHGGGRPG